MSSEEAVWKAYQDRTMQWLSRTMGLKIENRCRLAAKPDPISKCAILEYPERSGHQVRAICPIGVMTYAGSDTPAWVSYQELFE